MTSVSPKAGQNSKVPLHRFVNDRIYHLNPESKHFHIYSILSAYLNCFPILTSKSQIKAKPSLDVINIKDVKLLGMSGHITVGSCPTAVVNKKKTVAEMDQESSAGIALYDVVDETKKKEVLSPEIHKNYDENAYSNEETEYTELRATRKEESTYCVPQRDKTSEVVLSLNHFGDKGERWKISGSISQVWLCLMIVIFAIAFLTLTIGISSGVLYTMISRLRAEISSNKSEALEVSLNEELVNSIRYELELLRN